MIRGILTLLTFISTILLPWPLTALFALAAAVSEPFVPLAAGLFADTLYFVPQSGGFPLFTFYGAVITVIAFFVRSRLSEGIINK